MEMEKEDIVGKKGEEKVRKAVIENKGKVNVWNISLPTNSQVFYVCTAAVLITFIICVY